MTAKTTDVKVGDLVTVTDPDMGIGSGRVTQVWPGGVEFKAKTRRGYAIIQALRSIIKILSSK